MDDRRVELLKNEEEKNKREKGEMGKVTGYGLVHLFLFFNNIKG